MMVMKVVNIAEAKAKLSEFLEAVAKGERVLICKRNQPVAELRAVEQKRTKPRPIGLAKGTIKIRPSFYDPMPDDWLDEFYNGPVFPDTGNRAEERQKKRRRRRPRHATA
jgi:prevent-host-death family protein